MIDSQYQLKFNEIQESLLTPEGQRIFEKVEFSYMAESISIKYQLQQIEVDLVLIFDSIKMKENTQIEYI